MLWGHYHMCFICFVSSFPNIGWNYFVHFFIIAAAVGGFKERYFLRLCLMSGLSIFVGNMLCIIFGASYAMGGIALGLSFIAFVIFSAWRRRRAVHSASAAIRLLDCNRSWLP